MQVLNRYKIDKGTPGVYIGRPSPLGNPFEIGEHGTREEVVALYEDYLLSKLAARDPDVERAFRALNPSDNLICYCAPSACHGHVIKSFYATIWEELDYETGLLRLRALKGKIIDPTKDGITHINIYSKASTKLGRALSNFAPLGFELPDHGKFESIEGYWYWLGTGCKHEKLRTLAGYGAKKYGKRLERVKVENFEEKIKVALRCKLETHTGLKKAFTESVLPFKHYYYYGEPANAKVVNVENCGWIVDYLHELRSEFKALSSS